MIMPTELYIFIPVLMTLMDLKIIVVSKKMNCSFLTSSCPLQSLYDCLHRLFPVKAWALSVLQVLQRCVFERWSQSVPWVLLKIVDVK